MFLWGLDIANRLPLLAILDNEFPDYQIFITTYDKPWFEYARGFLEQKSGWKTMEFYSQICDVVYLKTTNAPHGYYIMKWNKIKFNNGIEIPVIFDNQDLIEKAENHLKRCDYKAAAVYARSAFEKLIRKHCEKKKKLIVFKSQLKNFTSEDFWDAIKADLSASVQNEIETYRSLVLNAFSHYNTEKHEIKGELENAINSIRKLKNELSK